MKDGIAYPQIIIDEQRVAVIEIAARIPGGHMYEVALYSSGIDMVKALIYQAMGKSFNIEQIKTNTTYPAIIVEFLTALNTQPEGTVLSEISGFEQANQIEGIQLAYCNLNSGDSIPPLDSSRARFGVLFSVGKTQELCERNIRQAYEFITIK